MVRRKLSAETCVVIQGTGGGDFSLEWGQQWVHSVGLRNIQEVGGARLTSSHWFIYFVRVLFVSFLLLQQITGDNQLIKQRGLLWLADLEVAGCGV